MQGQASLLLPLLINIAVGLAHLSLTHLLLTVATLLLMQFSHRSTNNLLAHMILPQHDLTSAEVKTMTSLSCTILSELLGPQASTRAKSPTSSNQHKAWRLTDVIPTLLMPSLMDQIFHRQQWIYSISKCFTQYHEKQIYLSVKCGRSVDCPGRVEDPDVASCVKVEERLWWSMLYQLKRDPKRVYLKRGHDTGSQKNRVNKSHTDLIKHADVGHHASLADKSPSAGYVYPGSKRANDLLPEPAPAKRLPSFGICQTETLSLPLEEPNETNQSEESTCSEVTQISAILKTANPQMSAGLHPATWLTQVQEPTLQTRYSMAPITSTAMLHDIYEVDMMLGSSPSFSDSSSDILLQEGWACTNTHFENSAISIKLGSNSDQENIYEAQNSLNKTNSIQQTAMPKQYQQESLADVLGDDRSLWSMFQRRGSAAIQEDSMVDMYRNDPDMRLLSKGRSSGDDFSDLMMLDNFNFSRSPNGSNMSTTSSASSLSNESLSRISTRGNGIYPSSQPTATSPRSVNTQSKRPPLFKRLSRAGRMSDEPVVSHTKSLPRDTDIKRRKTLKDYN